eukprot:Hpha_TRINITY_DN16657_c1_g3::TRINITY_DN16657_c1_g3_i1::g.178443::m.178443/K13421/UMPS; uridine monophosphate synthetase
MSSEGILSNPHVIAALSAAAVGGYCFGARSLSSGKNRTSRRSKVKEGQNFFDLLAARVAETDSLLCVGLDPHRDELPGGVATPDVVFKFCDRLIQATKDVAACYKPNAAFFECLGDDGPATLRKVIESIPAEIPVLLDCKRGDIGSTAAAYAEASYTHLGADAVTLSPYMGTDSLQPFLTGGFAGKGAFVLCKTSNPGSNELQTVALSKGGSVYEEVARLAQQWGGSKSSVGLVVGATDPAAVAAARAAAPQVWILAPGVGFQGGKLEETCKAGLRSDGCGLLLPVSRGISKAADPGAAARDLVAQINRVRGSKVAKTGGAAADESIEPHQEAFIKFALAQKVLKFDAAGFKLKSGRTSPYFFNAGLFDSGSALAQLGSAYASTIMASDLASKFDIVFGPAYKGISLAAVVTVALSERGRDCGFAYNRKEKKDHGEGGNLVGADMKGKRVLIIDDVITAGTAIRESVELLKSVGATPAGVVIALDRQEKRSEKDATSAVDAVRADLKLNVLPVVKLAHLITYLRRQGGADAEKLLPVITEYRQRYGA